MVTPEAANAGWTVPVETQSSPRRAPTGKTPDGIVYVAFAAVVPLVVLNGTIVPRSVITAV